MSHGVLIVTSLIAVSLCSVARAESLVTAPIGSENSTITAESGPAIEYLMNHDGISQAAAIERLELQSQAGDIVGEMSHALGASYGGVWFDNAEGRFKVGVVDGAAHAGATPYLESKGIVPRTDFVPVETSVAELDAAKEQLDKQLTGFFEKSAIVTGIDSQHNAIAVHMANNLPKEQVASIENVARGTSVKVEIISEPPQNTKGTPAACKNYGTEPQELFCDRPLRGGVTIWDPSIGTCSLGFIEHNSTGIYVVADGHCFSTSGTTPWYSSNSKNQTSYLSANVGAAIGSEGDFGYLQVDPKNSPWYPISNASTVAALDPSGPWPVNELNPIENIVWSAPGYINCHTGGSSDTQCGEVLATNETVSVGGAGTVGRLTRDTFCSAKGDSGGTVWGNHSGMGLVEAINVPCGQSGARSWYNEAIRDSVLMGLEFYVFPYGGNQ